MFMLILNGCGILTYNCALQSLSMAAHSINIEPVAAISLQALSIRMLQKELSMITIGRSLNAKVASFHLPKWVELA